MGIRSPPMAKGWVILILLILSATKLAMVTERSLLHTFCLILNHMRKCVELCERQTYFPKNTSELKMQAVPTDDRLCLAHCPTFLVNFVTLRNRNEPVVLHPLQRFVMATRMFLSLPFDIVVVSSWGAALSYFSLLYIHPLAVDVSA